MRKLIFLLFLPLFAGAQNDSTKILNVGFSLGYKSILGKQVSDYTEASLSPIDTTLIIQKLDNGSVVLSTEVLITPFTHSSGIKILIDSYNAEKGKTSGTFARLVLIGVQKLTFIASVNVAEFRASQSSFAFNKSVDGGLGLGLKFSDTFWIGCTYEVTTHRKLREYFNAYEGQKIIIGGKAVSELDISNNQYFYNKKLASLNVKFITKF